MVLVSSGHVPCAGHAEFERALAIVCRDLAEDVVRNGEGVRHVIRVQVRRAPDTVTARALGKAIVNAPLFKCAVAGNDPNVGRLVQAIGKYVGGHAPALDLSRLRLRLGGLEIFSTGVFRLDPEKETALVAHLRSAELYASAPPKNGVFAPPVDFPPVRGNRSRPGWRHGRSDHPRRRSHPRIRERECGLPKLSMLSFGTPNFER